ncbi:MFS transporter, partial [Alicyclobacillus shizuokensis]|uniref:MFS transporter n=1 Tax=Alicyclobacillus shizuokensis TaxID=392014 RepID=UPI0014701463
MAGVLADRFSRKWIMVVTDLLRAGILASLILTLPIQSFLLTFFLIFLLGSLGAFYAPAKSASIPALVGDDRVADAMGISQSATAVTQVIGMASGGLCVGLFGAQTSFFIDLLTFLLSAGLTLFLPRLRPLLRPSSEDRRLGFFSGFSAIREV